MALLNSVGVTAPDKYGEHGVGCNCDMCRVKRGDE